VTARPRPAQAPPDRGPGAEWLAARACWWRARSAIPFLRKMTMAAQVVDDDGPGHYDRPGQPGPGDLPAAQVGLQDHAQYDEVDDLDTGGHDRLLRESMRADV
jgi:hypothetical protein